jgi:SAM-dependent methyltransferase
VTPQTFELSRHDGADTLAAGHRELEDGERLFTLFGADARPEHLRGRVVLDLGCGYGGRTLYYARECGARRVEGVEITQAVVDRCTALAARLGCHNAGFRVGIAEELPFENERFDAVVSFDVLEHVDDPVRAVEEVRRVLRPGGRAWLVFPTYLGARSSHLDYVTRLPALHRVFDPDTIVEVVNEFLRADPARFGVGPQPPPQVTVLGRRTLPTLNGLTYAETGPLMRHAGLHVDKEVLTPIVTPSLPVPGARVIGSALAAYSRHARLPELLIGSIAILARRD